MISLVALGFTGYGDPAGIIASAFSHPAVLFTLFVLAFTSYCNQSGINAVMAKWFLSRAAFTGRPWVFTASVLVGTLLIGFLVDGVPTVFLISGILYSIFDDAGFRKGRCLSRLAARRSMHRGRSVLRLQALGPDKTWMAPARWPTCPAARSSSTISPSSPWPCRYASPHCWSTPSSSASCSGPTSRAWLI